MSDEIAEEFDRCINPDLYRIVDENWRKAVSKIQWPTREQLEAARRSRWERRLAGFDNSNLAAVGLSIDDLIAAKAYKRERQHGGQLLPQSDARVAQRERAYRAIHAADLEGLSWVQTISNAQNASLFRSGARDVEIDRKTLDRWMRILREWNLINIEPPNPKGRGRPRKKE